MSYIHHNDFEGLVGHAIERLLIGGDRATFVCEDKARTYEVEGDCCSSSWFADVIGFDAVRGKVIASVADELPDDYVVDDGRCRQGEDKVYGTKLTAADGSFAWIVWRNSSNGYYGGWVSLLETPNMRDLEEVESNWRSA